ncbi:target of EGR1 protein 1-like isoform X2 [Asterias rubens]|uniref:target of EGR1 protein 1-like isoform X2 n=1 Tax=Asterias rubens TaxID=7604 RepID=UPI001455BA2C|nr:target of EGR1 protein 1-like isoform X2 [Asterias rubens]
MFLSSRNNLLHSSGRSGSSGFYQLPELCAKMAMFSSVPVVDVHRENFKSLWPSLLLAIKSCSYVAIDAELSGLGNRRKLLTKSMEDRYQSLAEVAKSRSVLSLGISCFKARSKTPGDQTITPEKQNAALGFLIQTFNITTLCSEDYIVEPGSLKFLVDHGFDFNKQYASGVSYYRGVDNSEKDEKDSDSQTLRLLFASLIQSAKPVIFHNGLVDLVFLYQNLYSNLPPSSAQFIADLCEIFPGGLFDTKYLAEFVARMQASYLEYVFRKSQRDNVRLASCGKQHVSLEFCHYDADSPHIGYHQCSLPASFIDGGSQKTEKLELCETYAAHGHCKNGIRCSKSHDPDAIQDADDCRDERRQRKRDRKKQKRQMKAKAEESQLAEGTEEEGESGAKTDEIPKDDEGFKTDGMDVDVQEDAILEEVSHGEAPQDSQKLSDSDLVGDGPNGHNITTTSSSRTSPLKLNKQTGGHRAGYDAFMTGFTMATLALEISQRGSGISKTLSPEKETHFVEAFGLRDFKNKLFLSAKPVPLVIAKSSFSKTSQNHRDKMRRLGMNQP